MGAAARRLGQEGKFMIINNKTVQEYTEKLSRLVQEDYSINENEVAGILMQIGNKVEMDRLYYSNMMFLSITVLLELLYRDQLILLEDTVRFKEDCTVDIHTVNVPLNVIDAGRDSTVADPAYDFIRNRESAPNELYYQSYNTYESLIRRQRIMESFGDHHNKSILFLGDDELFCVYYALHSQAKRIAVLDIDRSLLQKVNEANEKFHLNIEVYECDLVKEFPKELHHQFDVFFASGLKDLGGIFLFIYSGLLSLNESLVSSGYFTFYEYNASDQKCRYMYDLETKLLQEGVILDHISVCDQGMIPTSVLEKIRHQIEKEPYFTKYPAQKTEIIEFLREKNVFSADPQFPLFSVRPIKIARVRRAFLAPQIEKKLNILRRFSKT